MKLPQFLSRPARKRLKPGRYDPKLGRWEYAQSAEPVEAERLTCATFNVWFGEHYFQERCLALLALLEERLPDVIALQEVTLPFLAALRASAWVQRDYFISDSMGTTVQSYGVLLLSRFPFESIESHTLPTRMERTLLLARIPVNGTRLAVGTMHLESLDSAELRGSQLEQVFGTVAQERDVLLMGDFNFCSSWPEEQSRIPAEYADAWTALRKEPGHTEDPAVNHMLRGMKKKREAVRFDRILVRSRTPGWVPQSVELLGTTPISDAFPEVFPSDHFGIYAGLKWRR